MSGLGAIRKLFHGGRGFSRWDPRTLGTGEGGVQAQGPGLYAGDTTDLAKAYLKYGGENPVLSELTVDSSRIFNPALKLEDQHREAYERASKFLDSLGYRASRNGIRNALLYQSTYPKELVREGLVDSGIDGFFQRLNGDFGNEFVIFNPDAIKDIAPYKGKYCKGGLAQMRKA